MTSVSDLAQLRAAPRLKLFLPTQLRVRAETVRAHLLNLSTTGALVHTAAAPAPGARVQIGCGAAMRPARVVWSQGRRFGVAFVEPLSGHQVQEVVAGRDAEVAIASARIGPLRG